MRKILVVVAMGWIGVNLAGAWMAVDRDLPYDLAFLDQPGAVARVAEDWVYGWGNALAVPLVVLAAAAIATVMASTSDRVGRLGSALLALAGVASLVRLLAEQLTLDRLSAEDLGSDEPLLIVGNLVLSALLVLLGFLTWLTSPRDRYS